MARVSGYHYVIGRNGKRKRVYTRSTVAKRTKGITRSRRGTGRTSPHYNSDVIMGFGAYRFGRKSRGIREPGIPRVQNSTRGVIVRHKEFLTDVPSSISFSSVTYPLNPGIDGSFPWLARVAQNFEEWLPRGIVVEYRTTSSDTLLAANPALGSVIIATQYNSVNPDFTNKQQMENYEGAISCKPSVSMIHQVETKRSQTQQDEFYIRTAAPPANADLRLYDLGKVQVATVGSQANGNIIGEIWISYEVELRKPKIPTDQIVETAHFIIPVGTAGVSPAAPFGTSTALRLPTSGSTLAATIQGNAAYGQINFGNTARGYYLIVLTTYFATGGTDGANAFTPSGCAILNAWQNNTAAEGFVVDAATATLQARVDTVMVNVSTDVAFLRWTNNGTATGAMSAAFDVYITELPDTLN